MRVRSLLSLKYISSSYFDRHLYRRVMFRLLLVVTCLLVGVFAFTPTISRSTKSTLSMMAGKSRSVPLERSSLAGLVGSETGFDPVGFSEYIPVSFLREAELKHGRIAMLGFLGFVVSEYIHLPGEIHNVSPVAAHDVFVQNGGMFQILTAITALEAVSIIALKDTVEGKRTPGDYGFDPLYLYGKLDQRGKDLMAYKEIKNGRLAMLGFAGAVTQSALFDSGFPYSS